MESILRKEIVLNRSISRALVSIFFIIAISLGAFIRIQLPFTPVPLTMQTFFVLLSAAFLGVRLGLFTQFAYIFLGFIGLPIFTGTYAGGVYLIGPTAGYFFGFLAATIFIARFIKYAKGNILMITGIFCLASILLLLCGVVWLKISLHLTWAKSLFIGFVPFLPGDIVKSALAAFLYWKLKPRMNSIL